MKSTRLLSFLFSCSLLSGVAAAQTITINVGAGWSLNTTSGPLFDSQAVNLTGAGTDFLNVNAFSDGGFDLGGVPPVNGNQCQANAQGQRSGSQPLSGSAGASTFTFASFTRGTPSSADGTATCTPSGVLNQPPAQFLNMSLTAQMDFRMGIFGIPADPADIITASAVVTPPTTSGKLGSVNRLVLSNSGSISPTFSNITGFFYSQQADASANCTLKPNSSVLANTDVLTSATINLN